MNNLWLDVRFALRQLRKSPGFTLTAVLTLAFGIGAVTAIFSIVEGVLLRPLPFADPDRLVVLGDLIEGTNFGGPSVTGPEMSTYSRDTHAFSSVGGYQQNGYELSGVGEASQISAARLTAGVFPTLAVSPIKGRYFTQQEDEGQQLVTVISYQMWRSRFHADPNVIGAKILLDRKPYQIVGVMSRGFEFPLVPGQLNRSELWVPMSFTPDELSPRSASNWSYQMIGRLKPGISPAQAQTDANRVAREIMAGYPAEIANLHINSLVRPLQNDTVQQSRS